MKKYNDVFMVDVQEFNINPNDKDVLLDTFKHLMQNTSSLVKKAEFDIDEFAWAGQKTKGYTLTMERLLREKNLEQWKATFIKDGKTKIISIGQVEY